MRLWNWLCFTIALCFFGCWPAPTRALDLEPAPVPVPVPQQKRLPLDLELLHWETPTGGGQPRPVTDAIVSIDRTDVFALDPPAPETLNLHLVRIDFTLHPQNAEKRLKEIRLKISWKNPSTPGLDVFPKRLSTSREVPQSLQIKDREIQPRRDDAGPITAEGLEPVVIGSQRDGKEAFWIFQGADGAPVRPGFRRVYLLVQTPAESRTLKGAIQFEGKAEVHVGDHWQALPQPQTDPRSLEVDLLDPSGSR